MLTLPSAYTLGTWAAVVVRIGFSDVLNELAGMSISRGKTAVIEYFRVDCVMAETLSMYSRLDFHVVPSSCRTDALTK